MSKRKSHEDEESKAQNQTEKSTSVLRARIVDPNEAWERIAPYFKQVFGKTWEQASAQMSFGPITEEMEKRDYCGLLSQKDSILLSEVSTPITYLADQYLAWALVLRLHSIKTMRPKREIDLLNYAWKMHPKTVFHTKKECCVICDTLAQLYKKDTVPEELWEQCQKLVESAALKTDEAKIEDDGLLWWYRDRGGSKFFTVDTLPNVALEYFFLDSNCSSHGPSFDSIKSLLPKLVSEKTVTIPCPNMEPVLSLTLTLV